MATNADRRGAAAVLRRLLAGVEEGTLSAPGSAGGRLLRRLEGAVLGLEAGTVQQAPAGRTGPDA